MCCRDALAASPVGDLLITGGRYFDTDSGLFVANQHGLLVKQGKLVSLDSGPDAESQNLPRLELSDEHFILPGLFDLHAHYNVKLFNKRREEFVVQPVVYLANGATTTFSAGEYDPEGMQTLRKKIESGQQVGPNLLTSGPYFGRARVGWPREGMGAEQIQREVNYWADQGIAGIKAKLIGPVDLKALIEAAHNRQLTVTGHLDSGFRNSVNPRDAITMGIDRVEHFLGGGALPEDRPAYSSLVHVYPDMPEIQEVIELYKERGVFFDATITAYGYFGQRGEEYDRWYDEQAFFTPYVREALASKVHLPVEQFEQIYQAKQPIVRSYFEAGGLLTLGTDHFSSGEFLPGFGVHRELEAFVRCGIPPADAIRIATINGARAMNLQAEFGSISIGKWADFYIIEGNPLEDIRRTREGRFVVRAGVLHRRDQLLQSVHGLLGPRTEAEAQLW